MPIIEEGIYMECLTRHIGTGGTARTQEMKNYYMAKAIEGDLIQVQLLDMDYNPLPIFEKVDLAEFKRRFTFQPDVGPDRKSGQEKQVDKAIAQAEAHYRRKEYFSAEYEYSKALKLDEDNVRANFGVGKVYLAQGEPEKAQEVFEKLAHIEAVFEDENKHIFNELGIELRRMGLHDHAIAHYEKAVAIAPDDENLFFNIGRACYEKGDFKSAREYLAKALAINPDMTEAGQLIQKINGSNS